MNHIKGEKIPSGKIQYLIYDYDCSITLHGISYLHVSFILGCVRVECNIRWLYAAVNISTSTLCHL